MMPASSAVAGPAARPIASAAAPTRAERVYLMASSLLSLVLACCTYRYMTRIVNIVDLLQSVAEAQRAARGGQFNVMASRTDGFRKTYEQGPSGRPVWAEPPGPANF